MGEWEFDGRMVDIVWRVEGWEFGGRVEKDGQRPLEGVAVWPGCKPGATTYPRKKGSRPGRGTGAETQDGRTQDGWKLICPSLCPCPGSCLCTVAGAVFGCRKKISKSFYNAIDK